MNSKQMVKKLKGHIYSEFGTAKAYAVTYGVSSNFVSEVLRGNKSAPEWMLDTISVKKSVTVTYEVFEDAHPDDCKGCPDCQGINCKITNDALKDEFESSGDSKNQLDLLKG